jgi:hypothetical protein
MYGRKFPKPKDRLPIYFFKRKVAGLLKPVNIGNHIVDMLVARRIVHGIELLEMRSLNRLFLIKTLIAW